MRGKISITRMVSISLILFLLAGVLHLSPRAKAEDEISVTGAVHDQVLGGTNVTTTAKKKCIKITVTNKKGDVVGVWEGTTNDYGQLWIGDEAGVGDLTAKLVSNCPNPDKLSAGTATLSGVVTVALETKKGQVKLTLPADIRAGDTISGTVNEYDARGNVAKPDTQHRVSDTLEGAVIDINGQQHRLRGRILTFAVPAIVGATLPVILRDRSGRELARSQIQVNQRVPAVAPSQPDGERPNSQAPDNSPSTPLGEFHPPRIGQIGRELSIPGKFDGNASTTSVSLGNQPAELLVEWPRGAVVRVPENAQPGPTMLTVEEVFNAPGRTMPQVAREKFKFNTVSVDLKADKVNLMRGEGTTLHVTLSGLDDYEEQFTLKLDNLTPQVVRFTGKGNNQQRQGAQPKCQFEVLRKTINPAEARNGVITLNEQLTGIQAGAFTIHAKLGDGWQSLQDAVECVQY